MTVDPWAISSASEWPLSMECAVYPTSRPRADAFHDNKLYAVLHMDFPPWLYQVCTKNTQTGKLEMKKDIENFIYEEITSPDFPMSSILASRRTEMEKEIGRSKIDAMFHILAVLREEGDVPEVNRKVVHTVYFKTPKKSKLFGKWLCERGYRVFSIFEVFKSCVWVKFSHVGPATSDALFLHENTILKRVEAWGGDYDGWETSIEHVQRDSEEMDRSFHERFIGEISVLSRNFANPKEFIAAVLQSVDSNL
jgi:hypothetical protein